MYSFSGSPESKMQTYYYRSTDRQRVGGDEDDISTLGAILGSLFCCLLVFIILFCVAYPLTMYKSPSSLPYSSDEKWWCYNCKINDPSSCGYRCW